MSLVGLTAKVLAHASRHESVVNDICKQGVLEQLAKYIHQEDIEVKRKCSNLLEVLASEPKVRSRFKHVPELLPAVIKAISSDDASTAHLACECVFTLSDDCMYPIY